MWPSIAAQRVGYNFSNRRALDEQRRMVVALINGPRYARNIRHLRHLSRHLFRYSNIHVFAILLDRKCNVRSERHQEYWNVAAATDLLRDARGTVEHSILM